MALTYPEVLAGVTDDYSSATIIAARIDIETLEGIAEVRKLLDELALSQRVRRLRTGSGIWKYKAPSFRR